VVRGHANCLRRGSPLDWGGMSSQKEPNKGDEGDSASLARAPLQARIEALEAQVHALTTHQEWTHALLQTIPATVVRASVDGVIEYVNHVPPNYVGALPLGRRIFDFLAAEEQGLMTEALARAVREGEMSHFELMVDTSATDRTCFLVALGPIMTCGEVSGVVLVATDISRLKATEAALRDNRARLQLALDAAALGIWSWNRERDEVQWDERLRDLFGVSLEQAPRTVEQFMSLVPEDQQENMRAHFNQALHQGQKTDIELRLDTSKGQRWITIVGGVVRDAKGEVSDMLGAMMDITQRRLMEDALRLQQKMVATGQLSAGVAHNFNNMLAVILPALDLAREDARPQLKPLMDDAIESATSAAELVRDLMTFSKDTSKSPPRREPLVTTVRRAVELCQRTFNRRLEISVDRLELAAPCLVEAVSMEQAVMNLLLNAREAVDGVSSPQIKVSVRRYDAEEGRARYPHGPGGCIELIIEDNGPGIDETTRRRIMDPFFTTKPTGQGTGLGLSTAWATIRAHGGLLECQSGLGRGTTISIILPEQAESVARVELLSESGSLSKVTSVLVVDDEPGVRRATSYMLQAAGYTVIQASSGQEGLEKVAESEVDVVLMDYSMPGLSAEETLLALRRARPTLPVVSLSGLSTTLSGADAYLTKPVDQVLLLQTVARMLKSSAALRETELG
jgi:two-component system, cell cycle sensor histidine kinase and response regulator CckA